MATCKECLHFEVCRADGNVFSHIISGHDVASVICPHFKDKAKYAEQKHGRWNIILSDYDDCELMKCSCCGDEFYDGDNDTVDSLHNYCPNCGARMDGE